MPADEFDIIASYFAPLANNDGARGLVDDAAILENSGQLVVTTDAIVEGVHFLSDDPIDTVAKKALRVNLSDLAAKGAKPIAVTLSLIWPNTRPTSQIADFARGLGEDLEKYDVALLGGDTTSTPGPLTIAITAFGEPLGSRTPSRADAKPGEDVWVTGTIGDAWLGFEALSDAWPEATAAERAYVVGKYRRPEPPVLFADVVAEHASAAMDVSDGLWGDAEKLAKASGLAIWIEAEAVPISEAAHAWRVNEGFQTWGALFSWGDDYQVLFTAPGSVRAEIEARAAELGVKATRIGLTKKGKGALIGTKGRALSGGGPNSHAHKIGR